MLRSNRVEPGLDGVDPVSSEKLDLTRAALAATENLEVVPADDIWSKLYSEAASDESIALNRAINRVLRWMHYPQKQPMHRWMIRKKNARKPSARCNLRC